jgi:aerobic carbon-monoxide dehydrogenase large subunit
VAAVVAESRSQAEDAVRPHRGRVGGTARGHRHGEALDPETPVIHPELGDNLCFRREHDTGGVDEAFAEADAVVEATYGFGRHTGVCNEPRAILADYNAGEQRSPCTTPPRRRT